MNVFITLNFQIAACFRSQHAEVSICQRVAVGAFEKITRHVSQGMNPSEMRYPCPRLLDRPPPSLFPTLDSHRQRVCPRRRYYRRCGSAWPTSSFGAATNSFRHRKLGRKQSMTMLRPYPTRSPCSSRPAYLALRLFLLLLHRRRQRRPSVN